MAEAEIPLWLKNLPLAPVYRPTETEFADPIAFISRVEQEAAAFGICKIIPPLPRPSKKFVISNLNRSLSKSPELGDTSATAAGPSSEYPVFTTRQQELGSRRARPAFPKQVWQSGDLYTLEQFEGKSKAFTRSQLGGFKEVTPLLVESLFWKAVMEKPIYIEYANDVPGSGFAVPEEPFRYISWRRNRKRGLAKGKLNEEKHGFRLMSTSSNVVQQKNLGCDSVMDGNQGTSGWKLSNSRWNLQVIARSPGSLTRFMPDDVPGVTSPMVYIAMLFSWFAWHVEDHELHSMNFLHMGSPKTWYAVPQNHASTLEDIVRVKGYGESVDRLAAFTMLGEKTTLLSPEVLLASGVPCCRLVQHPGEFVVTFPRAYHVGFSHGFNCGEAANFATPEWLKFAKEAAIRRAAMNHLPMLSHQQLLYILTMSYVSRIPRTLISGVRSSRLRDRKKEEREIFVKKAFLTDMMNENNLLCVLLEKESPYAPVLWEPGMLPAHCAVPQSYPSISLETQYCTDQHGYCDGNQVDNIKTQGESFSQVDGYRAKIPIHGAMSKIHDASFLESYKDPDIADLVRSDVEALEIVEDEDDLPVGLNIDSGSLACVSCGTLGYPFMAVMQPSLKASSKIFSPPCEESHEISDKSQYLIPYPFLQGDACNPAPEEIHAEVAEVKNKYPISQLSSKSSLTLQHFSEHDISPFMNKCTLLNCSSMDSLENERRELVTQTEKSKFFSDCATNRFSLIGLHPCANVKQFGGSWPTVTSKTVEIDCSTYKPFLVGAEEALVNEKVGAPKWDVSNVLLRPRVFCLQHAIEVKELLQSKGGGHIRVICHSDYLKFKAYAATVAEEVGASLHLKNIPLENASQEDLNLISLSIDEEEHQEDGKDWTSKLGVNLRYCVKHRKFSASSQEELPSALNQMFLSSSVISVVSNLRWLCRKSRTPSKLVDIIVEKPNISANKDGGDKIWKETDSANIKAIQVYRSRKKKTNDLAFKDRKHLVEEIHSCRQNVRVSDRGKYVAPVNENTGILFTVPVSMMENHEFFQNSMGKQRGCSSIGLSIADLDSFQLISESSVDSCGEHHPCFSGLDNKNFVTIPVLYHHKQLYLNTSECNKSILSNEKNNVAECSADTDCRRYGNFDLRDDRAIPSSKTSKVNQLTRGVSETISDTKFHGSVDPSSQHPAKDGEHLQKTKITAEGSPRFALSAKDRAAVLGDDSEMLIEVSVAKKLCSAKCSVHCEVDLRSIASPEEEMQKSESPVVQDSISEGEAGQIQLKSSLRDNHTADSCELQHESFPSEASVVPFGDGYAAQKLLGSGMDPINDRSGEIFATKNERQPGPMNFKSYVRRKNKRKREGDHQEAHEYKETEKIVAVQNKVGNYENVEAQPSDDCFARSPCEGLRSRKGKMIRTAQTESKVAHRRISEVAVKGGSSVDQCRKVKVKKKFVCDIDGCLMVFRTKAKLQLHKRNQCTYEECRKRFANHKYALRHQRVHDDDRPFKCPWKGCAVSFNWESARTERRRLHTGERPYRCKVAGCGLSFRFVSDFGRHRRKAGHFVSTRGQ